MDRNEQLYERIDRFLSGEMSDEERQEFRFEMAKNEDLAQEVAMIREVQEALGDENAKNLEKELADLRGRKKIRPWHMWESPVFILSGAAALVLLSVVVFIFLKNEGDPLEGHFYPYEMIGSFRSNEEEVEFLDAGIRLYEEKDYELAAEAFAKSELQGVSQVFATFYKGNCELALKDYKAAEISFLKVFQAESTVFEAQAFWFLSLALYGQERIPEAREAWAIINDSRGFYAKEAQTLLEETAP